MDNFIAILRDSNSPEELEELKVKLFRENVRVKTDKSDIEDMKIRIDQEKNELEEEKKKIEELRESLEKDRKQFEKEVEDVNKALEESRKKLEYDEAFLSKKQMVIESGFKQLDADRQRLHQEKEEFRKLRERVPVQRHAPVLEYRQGIFFKGVTDEKGLKKRYKDLIKVFHPDNFNGDNVTLQNINREYETLLHDLEMNR
ncbi:MAG: hypothetical protein J6X45_02430 [Lachnospiraceae bacterium]|jgi:chromosome segregation ATPase|nr:hypothetical protein [Lachnospiraceae bacterium]MBP5564562.1 hypothetical protein [Lachnospiraceae bacterium]MCR4696600.1 hypothetical protein [Lachnospiraceae bacterium]